MDNSEFIKPKHKPEKEAHMSNSNNSGGIGILGLLGLLFIALKLTGHITWSWWWVTATFWVPAAVVLLFFTIGLILVAINSNRS